MGALLQVIAFSKDCIKRQDLLLLTFELQTKFGIVPRGSASQSVFL